MTDMGDEVQCLKNDPFKCFSDENPSPTSTATISRPSVAIGIKISETGSRNLSDRNRIERIFTIRFILNRQRFETFLDMILTFDFLYSI